MPNITCYLTSTFKNEGDLETQSRHWTFKLSVHYCQNVTNESCLVIPEIGLAREEKFSHFYACFPPYCKVNLYLALLNFYLAGFQSPKFKKKKKIQLLLTSSWLDLECMHNLS